MTRKTTISELTRGYKPGDSLRLFHIDRNTALPTQFDISLDFASLCDSRTTRWDQTEHRCVAIESHNNNTNLLCGADAEPVAAMCRPRGVSQSVGADLSVVLPTSVSTQESATATSTPAPSASTLKVPPPPPPSTAAHRLPTPSVAPEPVVASALHPKEQALNAAAAIAGVNFGSQADTGIEAWLAERRRRPST